MTFPSHHIPIQIISVCSTKGDMTPLRFRFEDDRHELHTVTISRILSTKATAYGGVHCLQFTCLAPVGDRERQLTLRYNVLSHTWVLLSAEAERHLFVPPDG
ncbi:MAG: hypothetical protein Q4B73_07015 [Lachnospiraceae bacterium]|nr:hypothetical protein [Lachnospiraceae bacterium]